MAQNLIETISGVSTGCIPDGQAAIVMRKSMENKNLLAKKGAIYVGTGVMNTVVVLGETFEIAETVALEPPEGAGFVLVTDPSTKTGLAWARK